MTSDFEITAHVTVGKSARNGEAYGRYQFASMPRIGEEIAIDLERGDSEDSVLALKVHNVVHFPISLEAPMGAIPSASPAYVMIYCSKI